MAFKRTAVPCVVLLIVRIARVLTGRRIRAWRLVSAEKSPNQTASGVPLAFSFMRLVLPKRAAHHDVVALLQRAAPGINGSIGVRGIVRPECVPVRGIANPGGRGNAAVLAEPGVQLDMNRGRLDRTFPTPIEIRRAAV